MKTPKLAFIPLSSEELLLLNNCHLVGTQNFFVPMVVTKPSGEDHFRIIPSKAGVSVRADITKTFLLLQPFCILDL